MRTTSRKKQSSRQRLTALMETSRCCCCNHSPCDVTIPVATKSGTKWKGYCLECRPAA